MIVSIITIFASILVKSKQLVSLISLVGLNLIEYVLLVI